ncbi:hypothetical protein BH10BAC2_BH10BAC2_32610 [soil metagenome]
MHAKRIQLTLFIEGAKAVEIEKIRKAFNAEQYALIKSHVTLCREDELEQIEKVIQNLEQLNAACITIYFGNVVRFSNGKGVLIPAVGNNKSFQQLRANVLSGVTESSRIHEPHITLMHPRNSTCTDIIFETIAVCDFPASITFSSIALIEQEQGMPWNIVQQFELKENMR